MRFAVAAALALCAATGASRAQDLSTLPGQPIHHRGALFISPAGEPFRPTTGGASGARAWFDQADANHDGALSLEEFQADHARFFAALDRDGDGVLDGPEIDRYETDVVPEIVRGGGAMEGGAAPGGGRHGRGGHGGRGGGHHGGGSNSGESDSEAGPHIVDACVGAARFSLLNEPEPIRAADANIDFKVSAAEWSQAAARRFKALDANQDGRLSFDELPHGCGRAGEGPRHNGEAGRPPG